MNLQMVLRAILSRAEKGAGLVREFVFNNYSKAVRVLDKVQYLSDNFDIRVEDQETGEVGKQPSKTLVVRLKNIYVRLFNSLRCAPDITDGVRYNAKHKSNIMALWRYYKRTYGLDHDKAADPRVVCYTNNVRLGRFIQHMTKWSVTVADQFPETMTPHNAYVFLLNPEVRTVNGFTYEKDGIRCSRAEEMVVLSSSHTIKKYFTNMYVDKNVISQNNALGKGQRSILS